jgi:glycosyltransferase involved in cell wall biosynthesis
MLKEVGLKNVEYLPNFRLFNLEQRAFPDATEGAELRFVFMSRLILEKGVGLILDAVRRLNREGLSRKFTVTFYGPVAKDFLSAFLKDSREIPNVKYEGVIDLQADSGYERLSSYDVMLFPTFWYGEGFPGAILDAYVAGLPVLASDWKFNSEIVSDNETGFLVRPKDMDDLTSKMRYVIANKPVLRHMRQKCLEKALGYHATAVLDRIHF